MIGTDSSAVSLAQTANSSMGFTSNSSIFWHGTTLSTGFWGASSTCSTMSQNFTVFFAATNNSAGDASLLLSNCFDDCRILFGVKLDDPVVDAFVDAFVDGTAGVTKTSLSALTCSVFSLFTFFGVIFGDAATASIVIGGCGTSSQSSINFRFIGNVNFE